MNPAHVPYLEQQAPRYTSYPTAPHFHHGVNETVVRDWLSGLPQSAALSLYVHVPYCQYLCWYCGCNTFAARRPEPIAAFTENVLREIELVGDVVGARRVKELHWGGGTPNILSPDQFRRIHHQITFWFDIASDLHHAIELDPRRLTDDQIAAYAELGVTRASIGAQDFNPHVQQAIGRFQPTEVVRNAVDRLRGAGIAQINLDLMYGLPLQSIGDLLRSVRIAASMSPQRIALFGYAHVPWFKKRQRLIDENALPSAAHRFDQAEAARAELSALGYISVGLDHFALPSDDLALAAHRGQLRRGFQGYTTGEAEQVVGFGPSAVSILPQGYAQNHSIMGHWSRAILDGKLPILRGFAVSDEDRRRATVIEQIMCAFEADLTPLGGAANLGPELAALRPLVADELVVIADDRVVIPAQGRPFCRLVAKAFDTYAQSAPTRHSGAV